MNAGLQSLVIARLMCPRTPIVFQYHGIEVPYRDSVHPEASLADKVIVSTPDLEQYGEWYDRPVSKMFHYRGGRKPGTAVMYYADFFMKDLRKETQTWCDERGIELTIVVRGEHPGVPYVEMPVFLSQFEYLLGFKGYGHPKAISLLAVEAYACGCKIVSDTDPSRIIEMETNKRYAHCCGSGGEVKGSYGDLANDIAKDRIGEAEKTGAEIRLTACPFCHKGLEDGVKESGDDLKVLDIPTFLLPYLRTGGAGRKVSERIMKPKSME